MDENHRKVTRLLRIIGAKPNLRGYDALREAVLLMVDDPTFKRNFRSKLYPVLAEKFSAKPVTIEKRIRASVESIGKTGNAEKLEELFGFIYAPTVSELITGIADYVQTDMVTA